jgi:hypothetical protein
MGNSGNTLSFETSIDLSGLNSGLDGVQAKVESFAGGLEAAMAAAATAAANLADAQAQLGTSLEGNKNAAILLEYQAALDQANASVQALTVSEGISASAADKSALSRKQISNAIAAQNLANNRAIQAEQEAARASELLALQNDILERSAQAAAEAEVQLGVSSAGAAIGMEAATRAAAHQVTALQATSGTIRELTGALPIRAVENFISKTLGLGPILQAAFPVVGAIAFGEIAVEVGEKFYQAFDLGGERARKTAEDIEAVSLALHRSTDALNVQIDKLEQEQAKLEKKPFNGFKLVLDEAALSADHLATELERVVSEEEKVVKGMSGSLPQRVLGIQGGTGDELKMLQEHQKWISQAHTTQDELNESKSYEIALQTHLNQLKGIQADADKNELDSGVASGINKKTEIDATERLLGFQKDEQKNILATIALGKQQEETQKARDAHTAKGPTAPSLDTSRLKVIEEQFAELQEKSEQIRGHGLTAGEASQYWTPFLDEFRVNAEMYRALIDQASGYAAGSDMEKKLLLEARKLEGANTAYKKVLDEIAKETQAAHKLLFTEVLHADPSAAKGLASSGSEHDQYLAAMKKDLEEDQKGAEALAKGLAAVKKMMTEVVNQPQAEQQHQAALENIETNQAQSANKGQLSLVPNQQEQLQELRNFHKQATDEDQRFLQEEIRIFSAEPEKVAELEKKLAEVRRKANLQWLNDTKNVALQVAQAEQQALAKIENDIAQTFSKALTGQESWAQASARLYANVADQFILNLVKMGEQELLALALHKSIASQKILADAKTAAADSYQWASAWGGPIAGAIAAAAAFAGVLAFDSFEQGGIVGGSHGMPVPIMAHAGERVLSAPQTQKFESLVSGGGSAVGHSTHINYAPTVNNIDHNGFRSAMQANKEELVNIVRSAYKSGRMN